MSRWESGAFDFTTRSWSTSTNAHAPDVTWPLIAQWTSHRLELQVCGDGNDVLRSLCSFLKTVKDGQVSQQKIQSVHVVSDAIGQAIENQQHESEDQI